MVVHVSNLFYREGAHVMSVAIDHAGGFTAGTPRVVVNVVPGTPTCSQRNWDVSRDDKHFLDIVLVQNWTDELKRLVPTK